MQNLQRYVSYVVGTFLVFPLRIVHILPPEEKVEKKKVSDAKPTPRAANVVHSATRTQQGVKRTSGQAQKNVRVKHKHRNEPRKG